MMRSISFLLLFVLLICFHCVEAKSSSFSQVEDYGDGQTEVLLKSKFRCQKPLSEFGTKREPCDYTYFTLRDAQVALRCVNAAHHHQEYNSSSAEVRAEAGGTTTAGGGLKEALLLGTESFDAEGSERACHAVISLNMEVDDRQALQLYYQLGSNEAVDIPPRFPAETVQDTEDRWRFSMALSFAGGEVDYKGYNHNGFSLCCDMLQSPVAHGTTETPSPNCFWKSDEEGEGRTRLLVSNSCPLPQTAQQAKQQAGGNVVRKFSGSVAKPLPFLSGGVWRAKLRLWRVRGDATSVPGPNDTSGVGFMDDEEKVEVLGRLVVDFVVSNESLHEVVKR